MSITFKANIIFRGKIKCLTGLHIGGSKDKLEIGGVDSPVLRDPYTKQPYIPGSSLKGRMRALLEYSMDVVDKDGLPSKDPNILNLFGASAGEDDRPKDYVARPTPLIVRDSHADQATVKKWKTLDTELLFTEYKSENTINRITSEANPRFLERVAAGSLFDFEMVYSVMNIPSAEEDFDQKIKDHIDYILRGLRLIEDNSLGKSGSRGYGKVAFFLVDPMIVSNEDYIHATDTYKESKMSLEEVELRPLYEITAPVYPKSE